MKFAEEEINIKITNLKKEFIKILKNEIPNSHGEDLLKILMPVLGSLITHLINEILHEDAIIEKFELMESFFKGCKIYLEYLIEEQKGGQ